jgi:hypothetical protein
MTKNIICRCQETPGPSIYNRLVTMESRNYFTVEGRRHKLPPEAHPAELIESSERKFQPKWEFSSTVNAEREEDKKTDEDEEETECSDIAILEAAPELKACSDGSYDPISQKAAFNWRIVTTNEKGLTSLSAPVMTNPKYLNPYRAEFAGLQSLIRFLKKHNLHRKRISVPCDSQSCIDILRKGRRDNDSADLEKAESDIITSIFKILEDFPDIAFECLKGHQDDEDEIAFGDHPLEVRLNIACNLAAKECLKRCIIPTKRPRPLEGVKATLYFGNYMVTKDMNEQIQYASQAPEMCDYMCGVMGWTRTGIGVAKKRLQLHRSICTTKMLYEWLNVGKQKGYMKQDHRCAARGAAEEDFLHIYHCTHPDMQAAFVNAITKVKSHLV